MSVADALVEWRTFYAAIAEAGGTLLGLVFVAITIHLGRHPLDPRTRALGIGAILALAALALLVDSRLGLDALPVFLTLMLIVGTQDAIDLLFGTTVAGRPGDGLFQAERPTRPHSTG